MPKLVKINERGFTLIEAILAILLIGIAVPSIMVLFEGLEEIKTPEHVVQGSFLGQREMEVISHLGFQDLPTAGTYTCAAFETALQAVDANVNLDCANVNYTFSWLVEHVTEGDPDTATGALAFAKKVTLTVTRTDGAISPLKYYALIGEWQPGY